MALTKEKKTEIIKKYQLDANDTGSVEVQVYLKKLVKEKVC